MTKFLVVRKRETDPTEVFSFECQVDAEAFFDKASMRWSDVFLCCVLRGPGQPSDRCDVAGCNRPAGAAAVRRTCYPHGGMIKEPKGEETSE